MKPQPAAARMIWGIVRLGDRGETVDLTVVERHVQEGTLFRWLDTVYDLRVGADAELVLDEEFRNLLDHVDAGRKFGVRQNGVTLLQGTRGWL